VSGRTQALARQQQAWSERWEPEVAESQDEDDPA
jgi:hypothetical protein